MTPDRPTSQRPSSSSSSSCHKCYSLQLVPKTLLSPALQIPTLPSSSRAIPRKPSTPPSPPLSGGLSSSPPKRRLSALSATSAPTMGTPNRLCSPLPRPSRRRFAAPRPRWCSSCRGSIRTRRAAWCSQAPIFSGFASNSWTSSAGLSTPMPYSR